MTKKEIQKTAKIATKKSVLRNSNRKNIAKKTTSMAKASKQQKDFIGMQYFWGGLGIILCATGAFIVLLWGIGMLSK